MDYSSLQLARKYVDMGTLGRDLAQGGHTDTEVQQQDSHCMVLVPVSLAVDMAFHLVSPSLEKVPWNLEYG
jgi:hypothetical protein